MNHYSGEEGFSFIEVVLGLIILAIGILGIAGMQIASIRGIGFSKNLTQASLLAQHRLEIIKSMPLDDMKLDGGNHPEDMIAGILTGSYRIDRSIHPDFVIVHYKVNWIEKDKPHQVSFSTIKGR